MCHVPPHLSNKAVEAALASRMFYGMVRNDQRETVKVAGIGFHELAKQSTRAITDTFLPS